MGTLAEVRLEWHVMSVCLLTPLLHARCLSRLPPNLLDSIYLSLILKGTHTMSSSSVSAIRLACDTVGVVLELSSTFEESVL